MYLLAIDFILELTHIKLCSPNDEYAPPRVDNHDIRSLSNMHSITSGCSLLYLIQK